MSDWFLNGYHLGVTLWRGTHKGLEGEWLRWVDGPGQLLATSQE